jgi:hypothetical protein
MTQRNGKIPDIQAGSGAAPGSIPLPTASSHAPPAGGSASPPRLSDRRGPRDLSSYIEPGVRDGMLEEKKKLNRRREPMLYLPTVPAWNWMRNYHVRRDLFWDLQVSQLLMVCMYLKCTGPK